MVRRDSDPRPAQRPLGRRLSVLAVAAVAVAGCGGSKPAGRAAEGTQSPGLPPDVTTASTLPVPPELAGTSTTVALAPYAPQPTAPAEDLSATTAISPLEGFNELPGGVGIGALDLAGASGGDSRERDALNRFHFRDGHARGFTKGPEEILVTALRFSSPADATAYLKDTLDSSLVSNGSFLFAVPVPGATGYREQGAAKDGAPFVTYGALFARGDRCFEQLVRSPAAGPERSEADAQTLARRQADRVGG